MSKNKMTYKQCFRLAACPYCGAPKGKPCKNTYQGQPSDDPHPSRARAAFRELNKR